MKKLITIFTLLLLVGTSFTIKEEKVIKGNVTDATDGSHLSGINVILKGTTHGTVTDIDGNFLIRISSSVRKPILEFSLIGYETQKVSVGEKTFISVKLVRDLSALEEVIVSTNGIEKKQKNVGYSVKDEEAESDAMRSLSGKVAGVHIQSASGAPIRGFAYEPVEDWNTEEYDVIQENIFLQPDQQPLSTFSIDVDAASYSNLRRMLGNGQNPSKDVVRIEEMINYFSYDYANPQGEHPFSINAEVSKAPWNQKHRLVHIGLQGKKLDYDEIEPSNLVFLVDVSGSMSASNKLPLLKSSMKLLVDQLDERDRVAIVAYAGAAGLVLPSTSASEKQTIIDAFDRLQSGGSTAGGAGIKLAYKVAKEHLIAEGNNRVILATDGDFNVGTSSTADLVRLIEEKRKDGIFLTITGFGMGNYKDGRMEQISNAGNGNYFYIDNIKEAKKVFVTEMRATLFTIAKDVKIQVEFNPAKVQAYRLIGYENRMLKAEDFNDDKKDAGELGAGHTVTALYEIIPVGVKSEFIKDVDPLKYQQLENTILTGGDELLTVKFRYKKPNGAKSQLITKVLQDKGIELEHSSENFRWSAAVASFGMILRDSEFKGNATYADVLRMAESAIGSDKEGYRKEFISMVESSKLLARR